MEAISLTACALGLGGQKESWVVALSPPQSWEGPQPLQVLLHPQVERSVLPLQQPSIL